ncbi:MAG: type II toxin-antitoxin system HicA family toxin [bacterium]|nr:type II toxin-antitoxin system HicA family toxin [bacterium]
MGLKPCTAKKLIRSFIKNGCIIIDGGKGSHTKIKHIKTGATTTIPKGDLTNVRHAILNWAENLGITKDNIEQYL